MKANLEALARTITDDLMMTPADLAAELTRLNIDYLRLALSAEFSGTRTNCHETAARAADEAHYFSDILLAISDALLKDNGPQQEGGAQ